MSQVTQYNNGGFVVERQYPKDNLVSTQRIDSIFSTQNYSSFHSLSAEYPDPLTGEQIIVGYKSQSLVTDLYGDDAFRARRVFYLDSQTVVDSVVSVNMQQHTKRPANTFCCARVENTAAHLGSFQPHPRLSEWYGVIVMTTAEQAQVLWGFERDTNRLDEELAYELTIINDQPQGFVQKHIAYNGMWERHVRRELKKTGNTDLTNEYLKIMWGLTNN